MATFSLKTIFIEIDDDGSAILNIRYKLSLLGSIGYDFIGVDKDDIMSFVDFDRFPSDVEVDVRRVSKSDTDIDINNYAKIEETSSGKEFTAREINFGDNIPDVPFSINPTASKVTIKFPDGHEEKFTNEKRVPEVTYIIN